jgi:hypothetical protein
VVLIATGAGSTGGLTALLAKKLRGKKDESAATSDHNKDEQGEESTASGHAE